MFSSEFNSAAEKAAEDCSLVNSVSILYATDSGTARIERVYDFLARQMVVSVQVRGGNDTTHVVAFSDIDRETLGFMREKLVELGGTPPALPAAEKLNFTRAPKV